MCNLILYVLSLHHRDGTQFARIVPSSAQHDLLLQTNFGLVNERVGHADVPHLANVVRVDLFRMAVLASLVVVGVRIRAERALNERREGARDGILSGALTSGYTAGRPSTGLSGSRRSMFRNICPSARSEI